MSSREFLRFIHRREHGGRRKLLSTDSLGPDCADFLQSGRAEIGREGIHSPDQTWIDTDDTDNLIRKAGKQKSRKGISEIEGKGAVGYRRGRREPNEFQPPLPHFLISFFPES